MSEKEFDFTKKKRVVVKIGSSSLNRGETGNLNFTKLEHLVRELCDMRNRGMDVCLVSSGAIAVGRVLAARLALYHPAQSLIGVSCIDQHDVRALFVVLAN